MASPPVSPSASPTAAVDDPPAIAATPPAATARPAIRPPDAAPATTRPCAASASAAIVIAPLAATETCAAGMITLCPFASVSVALPLALAVADVTESSVETSTICGAACACAIMGSNSTLPPMPVAIDLWLRASQSRTNRACAARSVGTAILCTPLVGATAATTPGSNSATRGSTPAPHNAGRHAATSWARGANLSIFASKYIALRPNMFKKYHFEKTLNQTLPAAAISDKQTQPNGSNASGDPHTGHSPDRGKRAHLA